MDAIDEGTKYDYKKSMAEQAGIVYVRGCEVEGMLDASGRVIEEGPEPRPELDGDSRTFRLLLDPNQYRLDLDRASKGKESTRHCKGCYTGTELEQGETQLEDT